MITGDGYLIVELQCSVRYTIDQPRVYLFEVGDPVAVLHNTAEAVLREIVASHRFDDLLTTNGKSGSAAFDRAVFQREALRLLDERCRAYGAEGLGLRIEGLSLHDLHPPQEVVDSYHEVSQAMEERDQSINVAEQERIDVVRRQEGESLRVVRTAEAEAERKIELARARQAEFLARYNARSQLGLDQEWPLLRDAMLATLAGQVPEEVVRNYRRRRGEVLARQEVLTDFRMYWERLGTALGQRDKVVIDADKVPGRRTLWLVPFEPFRFPMPRAVEERAPRLPPRANRHGP